MPQWQNALGQEYSAPGISDGMPKRPKDEPTLSPADSETQRLIGRRLGAIRKLAGIRQTEISDLLGFDQSTWSKWESGKRTPNLFRVIQFAARAKVSLDFIYSGRLTTTHPALAKLLRVSVPELLAPEPNDTDPSTDTAIASYRNAIHQGDS